MKKFVCTVCGYVHEGDAAPAECPVCHVGADKFKEQTGEREWAAEHVVGVAQGASEDITVSYTHLDVYKRQAALPAPAPGLRTLLFYAKKYLLTVYILIKYMTAGSILYFISLIYVF